MNQIIAENCMKISTVIQKIDTQTENAIFTEHLLTSPSESLTVFYECKLCGMLNKREMKVPCNLLVTV